MRISAIVAISDNLAIGEKDMIPWYLPIDLKYFRDITIGHTVIMGRKTFDSIGKALPKRRNIVIIFFMIYFFRKLNISLEYFFERIIV